MKVKDCMCTDVVCVKPHATVHDVAKHMQECHIGCFPVCDEGNKILGIVTDRDIMLRCIADDKDCKDTPVKEIMTKDVHTLSLDDKVCDAIEYMSRCQVKRLPVVQDGVIKGIITLGDLSKDEEVSDLSVGHTSKHICCGKHHKD